MSRIGFTKENNTFVRGLISEANLLAFPENASVVDNNVILNLDGSRQRRLGLNFEDGADFIETEYTSTEISTVAVSLHEWNNVADDTGVALLVVQVGNNLYFFDLNAEIVTLAPRNRSQVVQLADVDPAFSIETTNMDGTLVVVTGTKMINILTYSVATDTVSQDARNIKIRDRFGVDDELEVDERPSVLSDEHKYNLKNQGWTDTKIGQFKETIGTFPSNADVSFLGKDLENNFDPEELVKIDFGGTPAAKGHFIIDPFDRGTSRGVGDDTGYGGESGGGGFIDFPIRIT